MTMTILMFALYFMLKIGQSGALNFVHLFELLSDVVKP